MLVGRTTELSNLEDSYQSNKNTLTILYGRTNIGKTALIKEFIKNKSCIYYNGALASNLEQRIMFQKQIISQLSNLGTTADEKSVMNDDNVTKDEELEDYDALLMRTNQLPEDVKLIIIEEFQNIIKQDKSFFSSIAKLVNGQLYAERVMVICTSSSISWIENSLVSLIGTNAYAITSFLKLKELSFVDTVRMFPSYSVPDSMIIYAITGGVAGYMSEFSDKLSIRDNICKYVLRDGRMLRMAGNDYIREELRETSLYNTILSCIASGMYKLNELHAHTGFGRDKISVYLKNLIEREVVDKIFSYDTQGNEHTRKGLYRIKAGYIEFWYKYIYPNESQLTILGPEVFYDRFIKDSIHDFAEETFIKVGTEFVELLDTMNQLPIKIERRGRWWGKNGNIDFIACDTEDHYVICKCSWLTKTFTFAMFEELMYNINLAGIGKDYIYLFSREDFDEEVKNFAAENPNVHLISLNDL
jgi:AAA+ ATPase superfamily predicted ATPase